MIYGNSILIFLLFFLGIINPLDLNDSIFKITGYFFGLSFNNLDYLVISSIPIFGMLLNSMRNEFKIIELGKDILTILLFVLITSGIGLYILTYIGKLDSPFIPEYLLREPFSLYSTLIFGIGIGIPFLFVKRTEKLNDINKIGIEK